MSTGLSSCTGKMSQRSEMTLKTVMAVHGECGAYSEENTENTFRTFSSFVSTWDHNSHGYVINVSVYGCKRRTYFTAMMAH